MAKEFFAIKKVSEFQRMNDDDINNEIFKVKEKYNISDDDLVIINAAISVLTTRTVMSKIKGMR